MFRSRIAGIASFVLASVFLTGCASKSQPEVPFEEIQLNNIYEIYQQATKSHEAPPQDLGDFAPFATLHPMTFKELHEGKYIVVFNVKSKAANVVLAYEKDVPHQGGAVLLADGAVKKMTAAQFKALHP